MASVSLEFAAFLDARFKILARLSGFSNFDAIGRMCVVWMHCIEKSETILPEVFIDALAEVDGYAQWIVEADLGDRQEDGRVRVKGTKGRIEWLGRLREQAQAGGKARAWQARRGAKGEFTQQTPCQQAEETPAAGLDNSQPETPAQASPSTSTSASSAVTSKDLNIVKRKRRTGYSDEFERIYSQYPRREGKSAGFKVYTKTIKTDLDRERLVLSVRNYTTQCKALGREIQFVKQFSSFMRDWEDYVEPIPNLGDSQVPLHEVRPI